MGNTELPRSFTVQIQEESFRAYRKRMGITLLGAMFLVFVVAMIFCLVVGFLIGYNAKEYVNESSGSISSFYDYVSRPMGWDWATTRYIEVDYDLPSTYDAAGSGPPVHPPKLR